MQYLMSDIHGCWRQYQKLLRAIGFGAGDTLYVLGDSVDRGPDPMKVLLDLSSRPNVRYVLGNHDFYLLEALRNLGPGGQPRQARQLLGPEQLRRWRWWMEDGGDGTAKAYGRLSPAKQNQVRAFLEAAPLYRVVQQGGRTYVLTHAGIDHYEEGRPLASYAPTDFLYRRADYTRPLFADPSTVLVTGHTPTVMIRPDQKPLVYEAPGHLALDCGCVYGGQLAAWCLETGTARYVDGW